MSIPTVETPVALPPKAANRIRMASFGALTMLVIQFVLGTAYGLYGTAPASGKSVGMFSSPLLAIHVIGTCASRTCRQPNRKAAAA